MIQKSKRRILECIFSFFLFCLSAHACLAHEYERLRIDFNGDGHYETAIVTVLGSPAQTPELKYYTVRVGNSTFKGLTLISGGTEPHVDVIRLDRNKAAQQILINDYRLGTSAYYVLVYKEHRLVPILNLTCEDGDNCGGAQQTGSNNQIGVNTQVDFWTRTDVYQLNAAGTGFTKLSGEIYPIPIAVAGFPTANLPLKPGGCSQNVIPAGMGLSVAEYDAKTQLYLLKAYSGACGWISSDDLHTKVYGIPEGGN